MKEGNINFTNETKKPKSQYESEQEMAKMLGEKYPDVIKEVKVFDPDKIIFEGQTLSEIIKKIENQKDDGASQLVKQEVVHFLYRPVIKDNFGNKKQDRQSWINSVTIAGQEVLPTRKLFDDNRFKKGNIRNAAYFVVNFLPHIIDASLKARAEDIVKRASANEVGHYDQMSDVEKEQFVKEANKLMEDTLRVLIQ